MARVGELLASAAVTAVMAAAVPWTPLVGFPTLSGLARGRLARSLAVSLKIGAIVFGLVQRPMAPGAA